MAASNDTDWTEQNLTWDTQSYWKDAAILQRYTFTPNRGDRKVGDSSVQVDIQVAAERPKDLVELRLTLTPPLDLSQAEGVEFWLKVVKGSGFKARNAYFCSPQFKKLSIAEWLCPIDSSEPGDWQHVLVDLSNARVLDKATPNQAGVYDRHDVTIICLNLLLPKGDIDATLLIDGIRPADLPPLPERIRMATQKTDQGFWRWRSNYPDIDLSPRPNDGHNLALTVRKLTHGFDPPRPFLIWGIGPSYLNFLGDGTVLACHLRKRFPNAPEIIYKKHVGSSVPWRYVLGWAQHVVVPEQPDLVLLYGIGLESDLEKIFTTLRTQTTADIVVASVHWKGDDIKHWDKDEDATNFADIPEMRRVCVKHGVEFVENRKEWAQYLRDHNMMVEVDPENGLLMDAVHQSKYGALVINEHIIRHITPCDTYSYNPEDRERRLFITDRQQEGESAQAIGPGWNQADNTFTSQSADNRIQVHFTGSRIDLIGVASQTGGKARILLDGTPADQYPCFLAGPITPGPENTRPKSGSVRDIGPHGIELGKDLAPQTWTVKVTDENGNYELTGSITGPDGKGNMLKPFSSTSGQIIIPPERWRHGAGCVPFLNPWNGKLVNKPGDTYTFEVFRTTKAEVDFKGKPGKFRIQLFQALTNTPHMLELIPVGNGPVTVKAFDVYQPPMRM